MARATWSKEIIEAAIDGFESQKQRIESQIAELRVLVNGTAAASAVETTSGKRVRRFSAATIKRMGEAQKRRWAKVKGESVNEAAAAVPKKKHRLSAAGRRRIIEATKKRWAAKRLRDAAAKRSATV